MEYRSTMQTTDQNLLQQALGFLQRGLHAEAGSSLARLSPPAQQHPDALYLAALACEGLGRIADAEPLFQSAVEQVPHNGGYRNSFALFLSRRGRGLEAVAMLESAVAVSPTHVEAWVNLALLRQEYADLDGAAMALSKAEMLSPEAPRVLAAAGALAQAQGDGPRARAALMRAAAQSPDDSAAALRLAKALGQQGDFAAAQVALGSADDPLLATARADLLADAGRMDEAVIEYRKVATRWPHHAEAMTSLAFLLPQVGQTETALDGFQSTLAQDAPVAVWRAALAAAHGLGNGAVLLQWAALAEERFGPALEWRLARLTALRLLGRHETALDEARAEQLRFPSEAALANHRAWLALRLGEVDEAEVAALTASQHNPLGQTAWSLLSIIWRLRNDPRERWLIDYDRLVMTGNLQPPKGWDNLGGFLSDLRTVLGRRHLMLKAPPEQTLRGGTQTRGELFATTDPVLVALRAALQNTVSECLAHHSHQPGHPFLGRLGTKVRLAGSWSVQLHAQGFHVNHIHPQGWLSSAFYVTVPDEMGRHDDAGSLALGSPDDGLALDLPPRRVITPAAGQLVIFPSYVWHRTMPFESPSPRLTVAFDALPV